MMANPISPTPVRVNDVLHNWRVLGITDQYNGPHQLILCQCLCAAKTIRHVQINNLRSGHTKSCGCDRYARMRPRRYRIIA